MCLNAPVRAQIPSGELLWLRADSGISQTQGMVTRWLDQSGHGNDAIQPTQSAQPSYLTRIANGLPVVRFDGTTSYMIGASVFPVQQDYSLTFVVRINNFGYNNNVVSGNSYAHYLGGTMTPYVLHDDNFATQLASSIPVTASFNVVTYTYLQSSHVVSIYINGLFADSAVMDANIDSTIFLGAFEAQSLLDGDLAEVSLYNRVLSTLDRQQLEEYLLRKYAIILPQAYSAPTPGTMMWLRADTGIVANAGLVSRWSDVTGSGIVAMQDSSSMRPTLLPHDRFTLPAVRFNGATFMQTQSIFPTHSDYTLTFLVQINNLAYTNNVISGNSYAHYLGGTPYLSVLHTSFSTLATATIPIIQSDYTIVTITYLESRQRAVIYINGNFADSAFVGTNIDSVLYLGACVKSNFLVGDIAEVLLYPRELSTSDRRTTESYLFKKYGIIAPAPPPPPDTTFTMIPKAEQLYARGSNDSASVEIAGTLKLQGFDSIYVSIAKSGLPWKRVASPLVYIEGSATFDLMPLIHAELSEYLFTVGVKNSSRDTVLETRDSVVCGDAYIIDGQSNCIYGGVNTTYEFGRTFGLNASPHAWDTVWTLSRADVSGGGPDIGAWAMRLQKELMDYTHVPICIMNGAVGGTLIEQHARNTANPTDQTTIYGSLLYRMKKSGLADKAKAIFWYQGESNMITNYYTNWSTMYNNWKSDYTGLEKFYLVQIRPGCAYVNNDLRDLLRTMTDSLPHIQPVSIMGVPGHDGCHFSLPGGYDTIGIQLSRLLERDFYGSIDTNDIVGPNIAKAIYTDSTNLHIAIIFAHAKAGLFATPDTALGVVNATLRGAFFLDDSLYLIDGAKFSGDTAYLTLLVPYRASTVAYIPGSYSGTSTIYEGPWIKNMRGVGAFSFYHFPISGGQSQSVQSEKAPTFEVLAVPNPFSTRSELRITMIQAESLQVLLYDPLGREVWHDILNARNGLNTLSLDRDGLAAGHYFCKIVGGAGERMIPLVIE
jgi:hypothetical protein